MHQNQQGNPRKATDRVVDMVRSEGKAAGMSVPARLHLGAWCGAWCGCDGNHTSKLSKEAEYLRRVGSFD